MGHCSFAARSLFFLSEGRRTQKWRRTIDREPAKRQRGKAITRLERGIAFSIPFFYLFTSLFGWIWRGGKGLDTIRRAWTDWPFLPVITMALFSLLACSVIALYSFTKRKLRPTLTTSNSQFCSWVKQRKRGVLVSIFLRKPDSDPLRYVRCTLVGCVLNP